MRNVIPIPPAQGSLPIELRHLRVTDYCRVSTELEEQTSILELQGQYYIQLISENPKWENVGIFLSFQIRVADALFSKFYVKVTE